MTINVFGGGSSSAPVFPVQRSIRLRSSNSAYFNRTTTTPTSGSIFTHSFWVKRGILGSQVTLISGARPANFDRIYFSATDTLVYQWNDGTSNLLFLETTQVFRDPSAWYHIVVATDTPQATNTNRVKIYVNGVQVTAFSTATYPTQNSTSYLNINSGALNLGRTSNAAQYFDGYLTEINFIDGQALTPTSFGSINSSTGVWQPIKYSGTYGTNGFYLNFQDNSGATATTIGKDSSGNGNNWTPNGINVSAYTGTPPNNTSYDSMLDVPTLTSATNANFCVMNPLNLPRGGTMSNGNLLWTSPTAEAQAVGTMYVSSGKWYWEMVENTSGACGFGIAKDTTNINSATLNTGAYLYYTSGIKVDAAVSSAYGASWANGDLIGIALDLDAGTITFYKNNVSQGVAFTGLSGNFTALIYDGTSGSTPTFDANFGQRPFSYTPPTGFKSLNTFNLPDSTIPNGKKQFDINLWTGTGVTRSITNSGSFQPDLVWLKSRTNPAAGSFHQLRDSVRGASAGALSSNTTEAENTYPQGGGITAFNADGFTLTNGSGVSPFNWGNENTFQYVGWQWKAGGTAVTNTSGSISSQVSANPSAGFSIVTYTGTASAGATVGHGLNIKPSLIIVKQRTTASTTNWATYHSALDLGDSTNSSYLLLNTTAGKTDVTTGDAETVFGNGTAWRSPTSSVFTIGGATSVNASSGTYVAYCFSEIAGYSKFGSYTGNGVTDGPFIYTGFRPRFVLFKTVTDGTTSWLMMDSSRSVYNLQGANLFPNLPNGEGSTGVVDFLSNGFKPRINDLSVNGGSGTYIYAAFAENPFKNALAR
jgi:hypothetical protein